MRATSIAPVALLVLSLLAAPRRALAQDVEGESSPENVILADLGLHVVGVGWQRTVAPRVALQAALDWYVPWTQTDEPLDTMGGVLRLRPVFHLTEDAPEGLWLSPFVQGGFARADRGSETEVGPAAAFGASLGYAILVADHLHLSAGAGVQLHGVVIPGGTGDPTFVGAFPHLDGTAGYAF